MGIQERRERERAARRKSVLDATRALVRARGFVGTTTRRIAEACELSEATLFFHFNSKEEIFTALLLEGIDFLARGLEEVAASREAPQSKLRQLWRFFGDVRREHPAGLRAGEAVGIIGVGGLGTHAVQLARLMGAGIIVAIDTDPAARDRARRLGADLVLDPGDADAARALRRAVPGGVDLALECVGLPETVELAQRCLGKGGRTVIVGVGPGRATLPPLSAFVGREQAVLGSFGADRTDIDDLYRLVAAGRLDLGATVSARYPLEAAARALEHLAHKEGGVVRVVVEPAAPA